MRVRLKTDELVQLIASSGLSQNHWALKLGLSRGHWSDLVNGRHPYPSPRTRQRILEVFGVPQSALFEVEEGGGVVDRGVQAEIEARYLLDSEIGHGGMGTVFLARDIHLGRPVALKLVSSEAVSGIGAQQFLNEIATVAHLQHPNILPLFDAGQAAGQPFYVMPVIGGGSLRDRLRREGPLPLEVTLSIIRDVARALDHAHRRRVLHCDVKPANILLDEEHAYLADFGIARAIHREAEEWEWRKERELDVSAGTPAYVSPEQANGDRDLDGRSDLYSLACVAYEMLSGHPPFEGERTDLVVARRFLAQPASLTTVAGVPPEVARVIERGMSLERQRRPATAADFATELMEAGRGRWRSAARIPRAWRRGLGVALASVAGWNRASRAWGLDALARDLGFAWRALRRERGFAAVVMLTLGLGIGANATLFGIVDRLLLSPPPGIGAPDGLVRPFVSRVFSGREPRPSPSVSYRGYRALAETDRAFAGAAAFGRLTLTLGEGVGSAPLHGEMVTGNYFEVLEVSPLLGRFFGPAADRPGAGQAQVVLSEAFWRSHFGADSAIIGRRIPLGSGRPSFFVRTSGGALTPAPAQPDQYTVVAVAPRGFRGIGLSPVDAWVPVATVQTEADYNTNPYLQFLAVVGRLRPGIGFTAANDAATRRYRAAHVGVGRYEEEAEITMEPLLQARGPDRSLESRVALWLAGVAVIVLIVACANVTNLLLARGVRRRREVAVRIALGAGRGRLVQLLLSEALLLAVGGGLIGLAIARWGGESLRATLLPQVDWQGVPIDLRVLAVSVAVTLATGLTVALLPSRAAARTDLTSALRTTGQVGGRTKTRIGLLLVQVALSTILLVGAGLFLRSLTRAKATDLGVRLPGLLSVYWPTDPRADPVVARQEARDAVAALAALPGIASVSATHGGPFYTNWAESVSIPGIDSIPSLDGGGPYFFAVGPDYFTTTGTAIVQGRPFTAVDGAGGSPVVIVDTRMAQTFWPGRSPVGQCMIVGPAGSPCREVVGVAHNVHRQGLVEEPFFQFYVPLQQRPDVPDLLLLRTDQAAALMIEPVRRALQERFPDLAYPTVRTMEEIAGRETRPWRLGATMFTLFAGLALLVAAVGVFGVLAYLVAQQTREFGVRLALGDTAGGLTRRIIMRGMGWAVIGVLLGGGVAIVVGRQVAPLLFGTSPYDLAIYGVASGTLLGAALLACLFPALRVVRVEPTEALRAD